MVFAPREIADNIGWECRRNADSPTKDNISENTISSSAKTKPNVLKRKQIKQSSTDKRKRSGKEDATDTTYYGNTKTNDSSSVSSIHIETSSENNVPYSIVTFPQPSCEIIYLVGSAKILSLEGNVEILGFTLTSDSKKMIVVDSPPWMSSLSISTITNPIENDCVKIKVISMKESGSSYDIILNHQSVQTPLVVSKRWKDTADEIICSLSKNHSCSQDRRNNIILVCGAKNVGKSTYAKYLSNRVLSQQSFDKIALLDCDTGQPELSPPGMLSLSILTKPLICPSYVHIICNGEEHKNYEDDQYTSDVEHVSSIYYGSTTSKTNPISYMNALKELLSDYYKICTESLQNIPVIINTDGWVKGMGFEILSSIIDTANPNHIVQIIGQTRAKFFDLIPHANTDRKIHILSTVNNILADNALHGASKSSLELQSKERNDRTFTGTIVSNGKESTSFPPSLLRQFRMCVYFAGGYQSFLSTGAIFEQSGIIDDKCELASYLANMVPYVVPFDALKCVIMDEDGNNRVCSPSDENNIDIIYDTLNGSIVGLCCDSTPPTNVHRCVGLGIVRSIDRRKKLYYILTPVSAKKLQNHVTTLVRGPSQLPLECTFLGYNASSLPYQSSDGISFGSGEVMKSNIMY
jgi:polynucleotide 5'-hydroxyl-kinase GRC3/NOL9